MTQVGLKTLDRVQHIIPAEALDGLRAGLRGTMCLRGEPGYEDARTIWNAMVDRKPAAIVRAAGAADVMRAVGFARDLLALRGRVLRNLRENVGVAKGIPFGEAR